MAGSPDLPPPADAGDDPPPKDVLLDTLAAQVAAIDELVSLARRTVRVFDRDLADGGWQRPERAQGLARFLARPGAQLDVIVHDTRWLEGHAPRLTRLLATHGHAIRIWRTGPEARHATDPLVIVDAAHYLHRLHVDQPRAALAIAQPGLAKPLTARFDEIWATGEPALGSSVLGL